MITVHWNNMQFVPTTQHNINIFTLCHLYDRIWSQLKCLWKSKSTASCLNHQKCWFPRFALSNLVLVIHTRLAWSSTTKLWLIVILLQTDLVLSSSNLTTRSPYNFTIYCNVPCTITHLENIVSCLIFYCLKGLRQRSCILSQWQIALSYSLPLVICKHIIYIYRMFFGL